MKKYQVILTEEQLMLIAQCVEDCHRFACGQTELNNTMGVIWGPHRHEVKERLRMLPKYVNPDLLPHQSYSWDGYGCKNKYQRRFIAETYTIYREILHKIINDGVYKSPTLTCEVGGQVPIIEEIK